MSAVGKNTFRGFHRVNKNEVGASAIFKRYFLENAATLTRQLQTIRTQDELHVISNHITNQIRDRLANTHPRQLQSYNKVRKPVDLYIEALVSMAIELDPNRRALTPLLFLPLDSQIFAHPALFTERQLLDNGLSRRSTFANVAIEDAYLTLQSILLSKAKNLSDVLGQAFFRIYFDLLWNNRYLTDGTNLFRTNPGA